MNLKRKEKSMISLAILISQTSRDDGVELKWKIDVVQVHGGRN